jgi:hypothetical protein
MSSHLLQLWAEHGRAEQQLRGQQHHGAHLAAQPAHTAQDK